MLKDATRDALFLLLSTNTKKKKKTKKNKNILVHLSVLCTFQQGLTYAWALGRGHLQYAATWGTSSWRRAREEEEILCNCSWSTFKNTAHTAINWARLYHTMLKPVHLYNKIHIWVNHNFVMPVILFVSRCSLSLSHVVCVCQYVLQEKSYKDYVLGWK